MPRDPEASASFDLLVHRSGDLYALPPVIARFNRVLSDPESTAQDVADTISTDVVVATRVLRLVNSSFFGFPRRIGSLKTAIVILGFKEIRKLVLTLETVRAVAGGFSGFPYAAFWRHSVAVGLFAEAVLAQKASNEKDDAFVGGLLHDLGKLIVAQELPHAFARIRELAGGGMIWRSAERQVLGFDHAELGSALGTRWDFPEPLVAAIRFHHEPGNAGEHDRRAAAIQLSDLCVRACLLDLPDSGSLPAVDAEVWRLLDLDPQDIDPYFMHISRGVSLVEEILGVAGDAVTIH